MTKYAQIYQIVCRLTDDPNWRAFFISFLSAESDTERQEINQRFWAEVDKLGEPEQQKIRAGFDRNFRQLLPMAKELLQEVRQGNFKGSALAA